MKNFNHYHHVGGTISEDDYIYWTDPNKGEESDYDRVRYIVGDLVDIGRDEMVPISECEKVIRKC